MKLGQLIDYISNTFTEKYAKNSDHFFNYVLWLSKANFGPPH